MDYIRNGDTYIIDTTDFYDCYKDYSMNVYKNRELYNNMLYGKGQPLVTIVFIAYNHLEDRTKESLSALIKYTAHLDVELILVDNGSTDDTFQYFQNVEFPRKKICKVTKNLGATFAMAAARKIADWGKFICGVPNDIIVTYHWLDNLLACIQSDERIGAVVPMSDNVSNHQKAGIKFNSMQEMQRKAAQFNKRDIRKWEERLVVIPTVLLMRSSIYRMYSADYGFVYYCTDDDVSFQFRRMGYKLMVCGDVFVHHGETFHDDKEYIQLIEKGEELFRRKYGLDVRSDARIFFPKSLLMFTEKFVMKHDGNIKVLGLDVRCGASLLQIKNNLRKQGFFYVKLAAICDDVKYYQDLQTVCDADSIYATIPNEDAFDFIIVEKSIDIYDNPIESLTKLWNILRYGGRLMFFNSLEFDSIYKWLDKINCTVIREIHLWDSFNDNVDEHYRILEKLAD